MHNLIFCVVLPLAAFLSAAGFAGGKDNAFISEKKWKGETNFNAEWEANVIPSLW